MFLKKLKTKTIVLLLSLFIIPSSILAYSDYIIPGGENIGIELKSKGVLVVGLYEVNGIYPGNVAKIQVGDTITLVNDKEVTTITELVDAINTSNTVAKITYLRNKVKFETNLLLSKDNNGVYKTGLYVKDSITGIGTLSFIDPETKLFGALGHEITEKSTGRILEIKDGEIFDSVVTGIERSRNGLPGEKNAQFDINKVQGKIKENTNKGIFGNYTNLLPNKKKYKVAKPKEITKGKATLMTVLSGQTVVEYAIEITDINNDMSQNTKNILFKITDKTLLETSGGIIQGMSGSPIIQNDKIIAVVTHVVVDNPARGYGIFITNMLEEAEN